MMEGGTLCIVTLLCAATLGAAVQQIQQNPVDAVVKEGDMATLTCVVRNKAGTLQWLQGGFGLGSPSSGGQLPGFPRFNVREETYASGLFRSTLTISGARLEDDAEYECQVSQVSQPYNPGLASRKATVSVLIRPRSVNIINSTNLSAIDGRPYSIECEARMGKPAANITWFSNGIEITDGYTYNTSINEEFGGGKLVDAFSELLIVPNKDRDQNRQYECRAKNDALIEPRKARANINVLYAPVVIMTEKPRRAKEHEAVSFRCNATGNPNVISWKWYVAGELSRAHTSNSLQLHVVRDLHERNVECVANNTIGPSSKSFTLNVEYGPYFKEEPRQAEADVGQSVSMHCNISGHPKLAITWRRKGAPEVLDRGSFYNITGVADRHFGTYTCTGSVPGFRDDSREVTLYEKGKPAIQQEAQQWARFGEMGTVSCTAHCVPRPTQILWLKDRRPLNMSVLSRYSVSNETIPGGVRSVLSIRSVQDTDYGDFNCTIKNAYGMDSIVIAFNKKNVTKVGYTIMYVLIGVGLAVFIAAASVFFYQRKRNTPASVSGSDTTDDSIRKPEIISESKVEFVNHVYGNPIDAWNEEVAKSQTTNTTNYDELSVHYGRGQNISSIANGYDSRDSGLGNYSYDRDFAQDLYGTYPRKPANRLYDDRPASESPYGLSYGSDTYGTYGRSMPRGGYAASDFGPSRASDYRGVPAAPASDYGGTYGVTRVSDYGPPRVSPNDYDATAGPISDYGPLIDSDYAPPPASMNSRLATNV